MYGILNQEELLEPLADQLIIKYLKKTVKIEWRITTAYLESCQKNFAQTQLLNVDFAQVQQSLHQDLKVWKNAVMVQYKKNYRKLINWLAENIDQHQLDQSYLIDLCVNNPRDSFVKTITRRLNKGEPQWALRGAQVNSTNPVVLRNIAGNEKLIADRLTNNLPMWFIDSGYTNFLTGKKTWHRLIKNHLHHHVTGQYFPSDRLNMFPVFPQPWRTGGKKILVVESSERHYESMGTTLNDWRAWVQTQIQMYTDLTIEFKSKSESRKTRITVYEQLKENPDDYYCVISESSAAAIEAVWLGVPVITLRQHISTPVARTTIADINNLYRGAIGDWLCAVSYSQFTKNEMLDGTAVKLTRKFYRV